MEEPRAEVAHLLAQPAVDLAPRVVEAVPALAAALLMVVVVLLLLLRVLHLAMMVLLHDPLLFGSRGFFARYSSFLPSSRAKDPSRNPISDHS